MSLTQQMEQLESLFLKEQPNFTDSLEQITTLPINETLDNPEAEILAYIDKHWRPGSILSQLAISYTCLTLLAIKASTFVVNYISQNNTLPEPGIIPTFFAFAIPFGSYIWDQESIIAVVDKFISQHTKLNRADVKESAYSMEIEAEQFVTPLGLGFKEIIDQLVRKKIRNKWAQNYIIGRSSSHLWYAFAAVRLAAKEEQRKKMLAEF